MRKNNRCCRHIVPLSAVVAMVGLTACAGNMPGMTTKGVPTKPQKDGPPLAGPVELGDNPSRFHRCVVSPLLAGTQFKQAASINLRQAVERASETDNVFNAHDELTDHIKAQVAEDQGLDPDSNVQPSDPWKQGASDETVNIVDQIGLSVKYAGFRMGRSGYTADMGPVMDSMDRGEIADAGQYLAASAAGTVMKVDKREALAERLGTLGLLERGSIHLAAGKTDCAHRFFDHATANLRTDLENRDADDQIIDVIMDDYAGTAYEAVVAVNYKALAEFLENDDRLKNNINLSRAWQQKARAEYQEEIQDSKQKVEKQKSENLTEESDEAFGNLTDAFEAKFNEACGACDEAVDRVATPYVNPLADFLSAAWAEHQAERAQTSGNSGTVSAKRSNAVTAYENAADLRPGNETVQDALDALSSNDGENAERDGRLVHVVMDVGRAPERKVAQLALPLGFQNFVPVQIPYYEPVERKVAKIRVHDSDGEFLANVTPLADIEAMALSHSKDNFPIDMAKATLAAVGNYYLQLKTSETLGGGSLGTFGATVSGMVVSEITKPGTESWTTLPHTVGVARVRVPADTRTIALASYAGTGKRLATETVNIGRKGPVLVYGRSIYDYLAAASSGTGALDSEGQTVRLPRSSGDVQ